MIKEKVLKEKQMCNWCHQEIGTNEWKCLKCQGYLLGKEETLAEVGKEEIELLKRIQNATGFENGGETIYNICEERLKGLGK